MKRTMKKRSSAWSFFEQVSSNSVRCKKCDTKSKYCSGATSTMIEHMAAKHHVGTRWRDRSRDETPASWSLRDAEEESASNPDAATPEREIPERRRNRRSSVWDVFVKVDEEVRCKLCDTMSKYMGSTSNMIYHIRNKHTGIPENKSGANLTHAEVTESVTRMIEKDMIPVSVVDGGGFRELSTHIVHNYDVPTADEITHRVEWHYNEKAADLRMQSAEAEKVALTAEFWTAAPLQKYITVSCSFITEDWQGKSAVLHTHRLSSGGQVTAEGVSEKLCSTTQAWGIAGKVPACVHNNKDGILSNQAVAQVTWDYVSCFATTLQLAVSDASSEEVLGVISAAGRLVRHISQSSVAGKASQQKQEQMCVPQRKLLRSNRERWDTVCDMFQCSSEQRWAINAVLSDRTVTSKHEAQVLEIGEDCWRSIENFTPVSATSKQAGTVISAEAEVSISNIYPITFSLIQTHLVPTESDDEQVSSFKSKVQTFSRDHMEVDSGDLASKPASIASMSDPRHKHLNFSTPAGRSAAKVKSHESVSESDATAAIPKEEPQETQVTPDASQMAASKTTTSDTKNTMLSLSGENYSSSYASDSEAQVDYYLRDVALSLDISPLDWWRSNGPRFPKSATLARHYSCIPGVTSPSLLSDAGQSFATTRTRLSPEHVNMMVFSNRNASI